MSFGPSAQEKSATQQQQNVTSQAVQNATNANASGTGMLGIGQGNVASGTNFFNTILGGNQANTAALLQPSIDQSRTANQQAIQSISTLQPRGGGRSGSLFSASYEPTRSVQDLFNGARTTAATTLPQIGLQQEGIGTNLFGVGNQALGQGLQGTQDLFGNAFQQRQYQGQQQTALGKGLFSLATTPFGGGSAANGLLGLIGH